MSPAEQLAIPDLLADMELSDGDRPSSPHGDLHGAAGPTAAVHVVSWGLGADSSAYLVQVLADPSRYGVDPARMIVLHAVVGSEWPDTLHAAQRHLLPLLAAARVRTVQVARGGHRDADGIVVLDDTTRPVRLHQAGPWTLAAESRISGTVPQLSHRRCSLRFKGWVLDRWIAHNLTGQPFEHVIGYTADEHRRAARDLVYATATRHPRHPLIEWGWTRADCLTLLQQAFGTAWGKSCCTFCPYAASKTGLPATLARMRAHPDLAAQALLLETQAIAVNPRSRLYGTHSLRNRLAADANTTALHLAEQHQHAADWSVYEVRRLHLPAAGDPARKGSSWRSIRVLLTGDYTTIRAWLAAETVRWAPALGTGPPSPDDEGRVWLRSPDPAGIYPQAEHFLIAAVAGIQPKSRPGFDQRWRQVCEVGMSTLREN